MNRKIILLVISLSLVPFISHADDTEVLKNDVQLVVTAVDQVTRELTLEGTSIGEYGSGAVKVSAFPFDQIDTQLYVTAQWTFTDASGATMTGANSGRLDLGTLIFKERGIITTCFKELRHFCGCAFQLEGMASDNNFIPFVTTLHGTASLTTVEGGDCIVGSDDDEGEDKDDD